VNYLVYLGEPAATKRVHIGMIVMLFLFAMLALAYALKREYWKDIH
jgi:ubiquinol-cytochrome c reductase cytochrome c1 subunit